MATATTAGAAAARGSGGDSQLATADGNPATSSSISCICKGVANTTIMLNENPTRGNFPTSSHFKPLNDFRLFINSMKNFLCSLNFVSTPLLTLFYRKLALFKYLIFPVNTD